MHIASPEFAPRCYALVPCAGVGERAGVGGPKQYHRLAGRAVVAHTLEALSKVPRIEATLVVLAPEDRVFEEHVPGFASERGWIARCGGATRAETVANGLAELLARGAQPHDWVLVHDAARCLLRSEWVERLIAACEDDEVGGLLALPIADTLKDETDGRVSATVDRRGKWAAQTPQMFRLGLLRPALAAAGASVTDEASAIEALGHSPKLVPGSIENLKLTWPGDFEVAERLLRPSPTVEIKAMVPAPDLERSLAFYEALGFESRRLDADLALLRWRGASFLLQRFDVAAHRENFVMLMDVDDLDAWWAGVDWSDLGQRFGARANPPADRPWGRRDAEVIDPAGVLWRVAQAG
ncbi:2-C-methyl-D-erythritol 4-phosphate cytidylyltransferase [Rivibacter subsaxonicus]|uniref:2-C-methyl-D-erythritol 4-phosphate cytidylyltransferase n=1 Tax=Rivibacter subsaxonicus TaxID=457575 RepID=A0A4Q7VPL8_9BURK|nr:2-C-methyl-D-erythritol 4-phosphate cytidylyltransferase [Rivibacter subsaxonicus]